MKSKNIIKICLFSGNILPLVQGENSGFGGAEYDTWLIARSLSEKNEKVTVVTLGNSKKLNIQNVEILPVKKHQPARYRGYFWGFLFRLFRTFYMLNSDIYFIELAGLEAIIMFLVAKSRNKRFVFRLGHDWETNFEDLKHHFFNNNPYIATFFAKVVLSKADMVITQRKDQQKLLKEGLGINSIVVYNALEMEDVAFDTADKKSILWVGRIHPVKTPHLFLELCSRFKDVPFVMVGSKNEGQELLFDEIEKDAKFLDNLEFIPGVPKNELDKYFKKAKIFVMTSHGEGFGNVIIDALKNSTPVVVLNFDPDGLLEQNQAGFCAKGDFNQMVYYISKLLTNQKLWNQYAANSYNTALRLLNMKSQTDIYLELFRQL